VTILLLRQLLRLHNNRNLRLLRIALQTFLPKLLVLHNGYGGCILQLVLGIPHRLTSRMEKLLPLLSRVMRIQRMTTPSSYGVP
jgi:hypothetical protein